MFLMSRTGGQSLPVRILQKGRWRVTLRKNESSKDEVETTTLVCIVLHNICINRGKTISRELDLTLDPVTNQRRDRNRITELLQMTSCEKIRDSSKEANAVRDALADKLFMEKHGLLGFPTRWLFYSLIIDRPPFFRQWTGSAKDR